jgi:two-component system chemotaxis response regulator CheY
MHSLVVEDDLTSRRVLQRFLSDFGACEVAVTGVEAVEAFRLSLEENKQYDLVCLDIRLPEMDGQKVLKEIRRMENEKGILGLDGAKVIMTTALNDSRNVIPAFRSQCDAYLVKPFDRQKLVRELQALGLTSAAV